MSAAFNSLPREVQDALLRGNKAEAVRLLREATGVSLKSTQARVDAVIKQGLPSAPTTPPSAPAPRQPPTGQQLSVSEVATKLVAMLRERAASREKNAPPVSKPSEHRSSGLAPGEQPQTDIANTITWVLVAALLALLLLRFK